MSGGAGMAGAAPVVDTRRSRLSDGVDDDWRCCDTAAMPWHTRAGHLPPERVGGQSPERKKSRAVAAISGVGEAEASDARPVAGARKPARFSVFDQEDCVTPVLQHLEVGHVIMLSQVSRLLRRACDSHELWAGFCLRDFGQDSHKIMNVYEAAELTGSSGRVCSGSVVAGHVLCRGIQYKHLYRKMLAYEIELHFVSGPMGTPIIKVVNDEAAGRCRTPMTVAGAQEDAAARDEEHHKSRAVSIGRSRQNDISILQDEMVSRKHGEIYREGVLYLFRDVGSINGTFINAEPVKQVCKCKCVKEKEICSVINAEQLQQGLLVAARRLNPKP